MDGELKIFYEDSMWQLQLMENALLDVKSGAKDDEKIGEIFRAMHTIKGNSGMFGFADIVGFTHAAENLLDKIRAKEVELDDALVELFLQAKDYTANMIDALSCGEKLCAETAKRGEVVWRSIASHTPSNKDISKSKKTDNEAIKNEWHISVCFSKIFFDSGMDVVSILKFFTKLGDILLVVPFVDDIPMLDEINPLSMYIGFEIDFVSSCTKSDIEDIFEFVIDDVELCVFRRSDKEELLALAKKRKELKRILVESGSYYESDFESQKSEIVATAKQSERVKPAFEQKEGGFSLRVDSVKIDKLINKISEMALRGAEIAEYAMFCDSEELEDMAYQLGVLLEETRDAALSVRMVQVGDSFSKYRRVVNDTALKMGKEIDFVIEGEETELDKSVIEKLTDPLTHMIRNAVDHGIESPEERVKAGKAPRGRVTLMAYPDAGAIVIELEDDGKGIDKEAVLKKAVSNGIVDKKNSLSDSEIYKLIFAAGLSTASKVSDISGRGVGMDVVRRNIEELRGSVDVDSKSGVGSKITVRLPLTLAIIDGFLVQVGLCRYVIPLELVVECMEFKDDIKSELQGATVNIRGDILPLLCLKFFFGDEDAQKNTETVRENVVVARYGGHKIGLLVGELYGEQQVVIKPLGAMFDKALGISGGAILANGEIAFILDIARLIEYKISEGAKNDR